MICFYCACLYILIAIIVAIREFRLEKEVYVLLPSTKKDLHVTIAYVILFGLCWGVYATTYMLYTIIFLCKDIFKMIL